MKYVIVIPTVAGDQVIGATSLSKVVMWLKENRFVPQGGSDKSMNWNLKGKNTRVTINGEDFEISKANPVTIRRVPPLSLCMRW